MGDDATVSTKSVTDTDSFTLSQDGKDEHHYLELHQRSIIGLVVAPDKVVPLPMETQSDDDDCNSMSEPRKQHTGRRDSQQFVTQQQLDVVNGNIERLDGNIKKIEERLEQVVTQQQLDVVNGNIERLDGNIERLDGNIKRLEERLEQVESILGQLKDMMQGMMNASSSPDSVPSEVVASITTGECQSAHNRACASAVTGVTAQLVDLTVPGWGTLKAVTKVVRDGVKVASDAEDNAAQMLRNSRGHGG
ncbi:hypothetical protein ACA910_012098 [Epithemia clementina (nom. ined.)]